MGVIGWDQDLDSATVAGSTFLHLMAARGNLQGFNAVIEESRLLLLLLLLLLSLLLLLLLPLRLQH